MANREAVCDSLTKRNLGAVMTIAAFIVIVATASAIGNTSATQSEVPILFPLVTLMTVATIIALEFLIVGSSSTTRLGTIVVTQESKRS